MVKSQTGRVGLRRLLGVSVGVTLPYVMLLFLTGCREDSASLAPSPGIPFSFKLTPGDFTRYNNWKLNEYGSTITTSRFRDSWTVADTGRSYRGQVSVTVIIDSVFDISSAGPDVLRQIDTLYFHLSQNGDVEQYGFLASLLQRRDGTNLHPRWDRIGGFSVGSLQSWIVGYADTGGTQAVVGRIEEQPDYVVTNVNGVQTVLLAYVVDIDAADLVVTLWMTDTPPALLRLRDESTQTITGMMKEVELLRPVSR